MSKSGKYTCPCCGFLTFDEQPGSYAVCALCGWEDDAVQLANPCSGGGANGESLMEAQQAFRDTTPDADLEDWQKEGYIRDPNWRPLNNVEKQIFGAEVRGKGLWNNKAIYDLSESYWNRNVVTLKT